jgi:ADP-L-glycero-D-manno-heptose 6-epimerase
LNLYFAQVGPYAPADGVPAENWRAVVNAGSGRARTFNEVARALMQVYGQAQIEYVPFPADLSARYQHFTEADLSGLRETGCNLAFTPLEEGVRETLQQAEPALA